jgi:hypothetical protein
MKNTWIITIIALFLRSCGVKILKFQLERLSSVGVWATHVDHHHTDRQRLELHGTPLSALSLGLPAISRTYANLFHQATASSLLPQLPIVWSPRASFGACAPVRAQRLYSLTNCRSLFEDPQKHRAGTPFVGSTTQGSSQAMTLSSSSPWVLDHACALGSLANLSGERNLYPLRSHGLELGNDIMDPPQLLKWTPL